MGKCCGIDPSLIDDVLESAHEKDREERTQAKELKKDTVIQAERLEDGAIDKEKSDDCGHKG